MSLSNPNLPVTEQRLQEFYHKLLPYMGGGGAGGGHTIEDSEGTDLTQRDTLQFGEGFKAEDDSTNEKTVISPDVMQSGDMDDVITPLPSVQTRYQKYSTEEQVVGEWINGKPVYQKTFVNLAISKESATTLVENADVLVDCTISYLRNGVRSTTLSFYSSSNDWALVISALNETAHNFYVYWDSPYTLSSFNVTVQYTKTTDTPNT